ncbi:MAG: hypothetical protein ACKOT0_11820 [bacterium]
MRLRLTAALAGTVLCLASLALPGSAQASADYAGFQSSVPYTVYEPYQTFSMPRTLLDLSLVCDSPGQPQATLRSVYKSPGKKIKLYQSTYGCLGQGTAYAPIVYASFPVQSGAGTAEIYPACYTQLQCEFPTNATIRTRGARVRVTLAGQGGYAPTVVDVYTTGISVSQIKQFVWSMGLA